MSTNEIATSELLYKRRHANLTQEDVATYIGVTLQTYHRYETGKARTPIKYLPMLAELYQCDPTEFLTPEFSALLNNAQANVFKMQLEDPMGYSAEIRQWLLAIWKIRGIDTNETDEKDVLAEIMRPK